MTAATETAAKYDKMQDAFAAYARENGVLSASDYREEGYDLGVEAFAQPDADRADWIENAVEEYPESARYLIACAAGYRLAELTANRSMARAA